MAAPNLGPSPTTEPQSKRDRVLHAAQTALSVTTEILMLVSDFTENVPYVNAVTGVIDKLIKMKKEVDDNNDRANVLVHTILDVSTIVAEALRNIAQKDGSDVRGALRPLVDDLKAYEILLKEAHEIVEKLLSRSNVKQIFQRDDFKSKADEIERKLIKVREAFELKRFISLDVGQSELKVTGEKLATGMQSLVDDNTHAKLRDWLKAADVGRNQKAAEDRYYRGTGKWFLEETPEFQQWKDSPHSLLWLHGISGCGKTMLSSAIIKMLRDNGETIVYFYFDTTNVRKQKREDLLGSLISRLSDCAPHAATILESFWKAHSKGADSPSDRMLLEILRKILQGFTTPVYIVLDALDESSETDLVLDAITEIRDADIDNVHLFLTSRTEVTHRGDLFSRATAVHLEGSGVAKDIKLYVDHVLATDKDLSSWSSDVKTEIRESLVNVADPMFRLVALQLDQLRRCHYESDVGPALLTMPSTMDKIYNRILEKIQSDQPMLAMVNRTLNWLIFSVWPVTLKEVIDALAVNFNESPLRFNPKKRFMKPLQLLDACAGLVSQNTKDGTTILQLAHASVKEYLTDAKRSSRALQAEISDHTGHYMIARTCIAYLCSFDNYEVLEASPLALYAAQNWYHHVNRYTQRSSESHSHMVQLHTPHDQGDAFFAVLWLIWIPMGLIFWLFQAIYESSQGDSRKLILALMELLSPGSPQYANMLRLRRMTMLSPRGEKDDNTPLALSAELGVLLGVQALLVKGANVNAQGGYYGNALQAASFEGHTEIMRALLEKGANVNAQGGEYGNALQAASYRGHTETVQLLLEKSADVNAQGGEYGNALHAASYRGHTEIVRALLEKGADVNMQGGYYGNALQAASYKGYTEIVRALLEKGADLNTQVGLYGNALHAASSQGDIEIVRALLEKGADVNAQGGHYDNALQAASSGGHTKIVRVLLEKGANVNAQGGYYGNALQAATCMGYTEIVQLLLEKRHIEIVRALLEKGADVNAQGGAYGNALQAASFEGHTEIVRALLEKGADVNAQGGVFGNALEAASYGGHTEIVRLLLEKGADVNGQGGAYGNALQAASFEGHTEIVRALLEKGANVNTQGGLYGNALQAASYRGHTEIVQVLLEKGANVNTQGGLYGNALQAASYRGHTEIVQVLLEKGADVNAQGGEYGNALHAASSEGHIEIVPLLLEKGATSDRHGSGDPEDADTMQTYYALHCIGYITISRLRIFRLHLLPPSPRTQSARLDSLPYTRYTRLNLAYARSSQEELLLLLPLAPLLLLRRRRSALALHAPGAPAAVGRGERKVDVLLRVEAHDEGGDVDDLAADAGGGMG
ncbi:ankyrin repeat-containing domain protein [Mycena galericulata]|nr:ankyrin repeat-containing domain protein [Mycena galericulata]